MKINNFIPVIIVTGIIALTSPFMDKAKAEPGKSKVVQVDTVILEGWRDVAYNPDGSYHYDGLFLFNASSSGNSPKIELATYTDAGASIKIQLSEAMSRLRAVGFKIVKYTVSDGPYSFSIVVMERES